MVTSGGKNCFDTLNTMVPFGCIFELLYMLLLRPAGCRPPIQPAPAAVSKSRDETLILNPGRKSSFHSDFVSELFSLSHFIHPFVWPNGWMGHFLTCEWLVVSSILFELINMVMIVAPLRGNSTVWLQTNPKYTQSCRLDMLLSMSFMISI